MNRGWRTTARLRAQLHDLYSPNGSSFSTSLSLWGSGCGPGSVRPKSAARLLNDGCKMARGLR
jgi:hypothetical protein